MGINKNLICYILMQNVYALLKYAAGRSEIKVAHCIDTHCIVINIKQIRNTHIVFFAYERRSESLRTSR